MMRWEVHNMKPKHSYSSKLGYNFRTSGLKRQSNNYSPIPLSRRTPLVLLKGRANLLSLNFFFMIIHRIHQRKFLLNLRQKLSVRRPNLNIHFLLIILVLHATTAARCLIERDPNKRTLNKQNNFFNQNYLSIILLLTNIKLQSFANSGFEHSHQSRED